MKKEKAILIADKIIEYCLYGLILFIPISKTGIEICASAAILAFIIKKTLKPDFKFLGNPQHLLLLLFISFGILSLLNSGHYFKKSLEAIFFKWAEYLLIFIIAEDAFSTSKRIRNAIFILLAVSGLVGIDGLFQQFSGIEFLRQRSLIAVKSGVYAITASFQHYNNFGAYLVVVLSLAIALSIARQFRKKSTRLLLSILGALLWICLLLTFSRGSWLGFLTSLILMLVLSRRFKILLTILCIFALALLFLPGIKERAAFTFQEGGDAGRLALWKGAWLMIKEAPFLGKGLGTFMDYFPKYAPNLDVQYTHNCFLQIWAESGIFSLLAFLGFLTLLLAKAIKAFRKNRDSLILGLLCGVFGFLMHNFFDTQLYSLQLAVLFWSMAGILSAITKAQSLN